jgi:hypothetical protein
LLHVWLAIEPEADLRACELRASMYASKLVAGAGESGSSPLVGSLIFLQNP